MVDRYFASHRNQLSEKFVFGFKIGLDLIVTQAGLANPASVSRVFKLPSQLRAFSPKHYGFGSIFLRGLLENSSV